MTAPATRPSATTTAGGNPRQPPRRIAEAGPEGWLGEVEGLKISLAGIGDKLAQIDAALPHQATAVQLGMPAFLGIAGRTVTPGH